MFETIVPLARVRHEAVDVIGAEGLLIPVTDHTNHHFLVVRRDYVPILVDDRAARIRRWRTESYTGLL
jgi:hypothetical protein